MKSLLGIVATLLLASTASASPPGDTPPAGDGQWKQKLKARFDLDHDGTLSPEERWVAKHAIRRHLQKKFDRNGDGRLGPRERATMRGRIFDRAIRRFDRDRDGVIGPGEAPPRLVQRLKRLDRNGDGWLTRDEVVLMRRGRGSGPAAPAGQHEPDAGGE